MIRGASIASRRKSRTVHMGAAMAFTFSLVLCLGGLSYQAHAVFEPGVGSDNNNTASKEKSQDQSSSNQGSTTPTPSSVSPSPTSTSSSQDTASKANNAAAKQEIVNNNMFIWGGGLITLLIAIGGVAWLMKGKKRS